MSIDCICKKIPTIDYLSISTRYNIKIFETRLPKIQSEDESRKYTGKNLRAINHSRKRVCVDEKKIDREERKGDKLFHHQSPID